MSNCKDCPSFQGRCDSCYIVEGITTIKEVTFCKDCNAYICDSCRDNWIKRGVAYFLNKLGVKKVMQPEITREEIITDAEIETIIEEVKNESDEIATVEFTEEKKENIDFQTDEPLEKDDNLYS